jgi:hypothetical protein
MAIPLFSFGTLRDPGVQGALFGRTVAGADDAILGYRVGRVRIVDPEAIAASGTDVHPALLVTGDPADVVEGSLLDLTEVELAAVDRYESVSFRAIDVVTRSGTKAVAYAPRPELDVQPT